MRKEVWGFQENVIVFLDEELIGGHEDFLKWAMDNHEYKDFRFARILNVLNTWCHPFNILYILTIQSLPFLLKCRVIFDGLEPFGNLSKNFRKQRELALKK